MFNKPGLVNSYRHQRVFVFLLYGKISLVLEQRFPQKVGTLVTQICYHNDAADSLSKSALFLLTDKSTPRLISIA
jgi:hypothetical protein